MMRVLLLAIALCLSVAIAAPITSLPGYSGPALPPMESGYVNINETMGKNVFWWSSQAEEDYQNKPLIVWFQGGPGCSSLAGLLTENGPVQIADGGGLRHNPLGWTKFANMLWFEQPVGVGFSYADNPAAYNTGDAEAAHDNYVFLTRWLEQNPQWKGFPTYLTGESYGGVYVPSVTELILSNPGTPLYNQMAGLAVGNPVFNCLGDIDNGFDSVTVDLLYWHALVSQSNYDAWNAAGCGNNSTSTACQSILNATITEVGEINQPVLSKNQPSLDPDDLYQDFCLGNGTLNFVESVGYPEACKSSDLDELLPAYLNRKDVQDAIHVSSKANQPWSTCTGRINYDVSGKSMVPNYKAFPSQKTGFKIMVYSGDVDILTVPFAYTMPCIEMIGGLKKQTWGPWWVNSATAGYWESRTVGSSTLIYATVKGAGHETPTYQPFSAFQMMSRFIKTGTLASSEHEPKARSENTGSVSQRQGSIIRKLRQEGKIPLF